MDFNPRVKREKGKMRMEVAAMRVCDTGRVDGVTHPFLGLLWVEMESTLQKLRLGVREREHECELQP